MSGFTGAYQQLNAAQKRAVDTLEGPVLVLAGPGTGKTQLLAVRVANILKQTDALPQNILCLTFTESGQRAMRERLQRFIGKDALHVTISTYHAFGNDLLKRYPEFIETPGQRPIDELLQDQLLRQVLEVMPFSNPFKSAAVYLSDIKGFISDAKRALLTPADLRDIAQANLTCLTEAGELCQTQLASLKSVSKSAVPLFAGLADGLAALNFQSESLSLPKHIPPLHTLASQELAEALAEAEESGKTQPVTKWKSKWLAKDTSGKFILDGVRAATRLMAAADIYEQYEKALERKGIIDYDDMIIRAISVLESNDDLRFTLQEQYQYILLDEFQDTNPAQLKLIQLLTDNPVHEGRPNVLAVGDDDQAIYAFQGASYSNMRTFVDMFEGVAVIPLTENYRSHRDVLHIAHIVADQIEERLHHHIEGVNKVLIAANQSIPKQAHIEKHEFPTDASELRWIAGKIKTLIESGTNPSDIAVLAPKHKFLEPLIPYLNELHIPSVYEKRENVLDDPVVDRLFTMARLVEALSIQDESAADSLWPLVLSYEFWGIPTETIWNISWQSYKSKDPWHPFIMQDVHLKPIGLFFTRLGHIAREQTLEALLDYLIGVEALEIPGANPYLSPFFEHYFSDQASARDITAYWHALSMLTVLRERLRDYKATEDAALTISDFIEFVTAHRTAEIKIVNTSPYRQSDDAVQIMTAYRSKGLEFDAVFVIACSDEVWGMKARAASSNITLPANLAHIKYAGANNDERLRLFFVAITRARHHLYLTSHLKTYAAKLTSPLSYLDVLDAEENETGAQNPIPSLVHVAHQDDAIAVSDKLQELASYWSDRHVRSLTQTSLAHLLVDRLKGYQLSASHLNNFVDTAYGGPREFFLTSILRFPKAPRPDGQYGNAIHETLQWVHIYNRSNGSLPSQKQIDEYFTERLVDKRLGDMQTGQYAERGKQALQAYMSARADSFAPTDEHEFNFRNEGVTVGDALLTGKIDKLRIDRQARVITVVDYKTGKSYDKWAKSDMKLHKYRQQLIIYKLLVEGSHTFKGYRVEQGILDFVEPDSDGRINSLTFSYTQADINHVKRLIEAVWQKIMHLDFPTQDSYDANTAGMQAFENDLIEGTI